VHGGDLPIAIRPPGKLVGRNLRKTYASSDTEKIFARRKSIPSITGWQVQPDIRGVWRELLPDWGLGWTT